MKKFFYPGIILSLLLLTVFSGCGGGNSNGNPGGTYTPGQSSTYTVDAVSFTMNYAPSGSFASDDNTVSGQTGFSATVQVSNAYWIAETDVTYQLWYAVYTWATDTARGANRYYFQNAGAEGSMGTVGAVPTANNQHPVTSVSWRDAMVWCNALTEYYNVQNGTNLACVYTNSTIIRDSRDPNATTCDGVTASSTAKGFRLPTSAEWELAARYQDGTNWTLGDHASGDTSGYCYKNTSIISATASTIFGNYAWYKGNSTSSSTKQVGQKTANALGLYDMNGNVWQMCFDWYPGNSSERVHRGGSWYNGADALQLGYVSPINPSSTSSNFGFRPVRTQ